MTCESFSKGASIFHRADPRVKILLLALVTLLVIAIQQLDLLLLAFLFACFFLIVAGLESKILIRRLAVINMFILLMWMTLPWTTPGRILFSMGPLQITAQGISLSASITLKCNTIMILNMVFLSTSTIFSLTHALAHLKVPNTLVQLFFFSWRYLHVIEDEYARLKKAALLRGFRPGTNLFTYRTYAYLLGTLFVKSHDRGQRVYNALLCRGFDGTFWLLSHFRLTRDDLVLTLGVLLLFTPLFLISGGWFVPN